MGPRAGQGRAPRAELFRALGVLCEPPTSATPGIVDTLGLGRAPDESDYAELFLFELYPYASVYLGAKGWMGGEARDRIAGFWRALGLTPPAEPDHLATLLAFYAGMVQAVDEAAGERARDTAERARAAFLYEHLLSWVPVFLGKFDRLAGDPYREWGKLLTSALEMETSRAPLPEQLPLHLREAPELESPAEVGGESFLKGLLAPARTGWILTRSDLAQAAAEIGLGLRAGERTFALKALLGQDAAGTLDWMSREASRQAREHERCSALPEPVRRFWARRARASARILAGARDSL